jgi:hypothetical protein
MYLTPLALLPYDSHRHPSHPSNNLRLRRVLETPHVLVGVGMWNHHELSTINLTPTAGISIPQFGEVRGSEAFDLLQLLNTGHSGTLSTIHASSAQQGLSRFTSCVLQSGVELPFRAIKTNIADSLNVVIHVERRPGRRYISEVLLVNSYDPDADLFDYGAVFLAKRDRP